MKKEVSLYVLLLFVFGVIVGEADAQTQSTTKEEIVITTYYPVPYGDYDKFLANRLAIGDTNGDKTLSIEDISPQDGQLAVAKSVIFTPQKDSPENWSAGTSGELAFSKDEGEYYYYNGSKWVAQGGGGGAMFTVYGTTSCPDAQGWTKFYDGSALMGIAWWGGNAALSGAAGIVCKAGAAYSQNQFSFGLHWMTSHYSVSTEPLPCAVCVYTK